MVEIRRKLVLMKPARGYIVCCLERTGSTMLSDALAWTGIAGRPKEYFNPVLQGEGSIGALLGDVTLPEDLDKVLSVGSSANGVFGAKIHWGHFIFLGLSLRGQWTKAYWSSIVDELRQLQTSSLLSQSAIEDFLESRFPDMRLHAEAYSLLRSNVPDLRVIWLKRRNMVARAVSEYRARRSGVWHRVGPAFYPSNPVESFDPVEIHILYCAAAFKEKRWGQFFVEQNISPLDLFYEDLVEEYDSSIRRVIEFLSLDSSNISILQPMTTKQADALSEEWEDRYRTINKRPEDVLVIECKGVSLKESAKLREIVD